jgi:hypothetical protein
MLYLEDIKTVSGIPTANGFMPIGFPLLKLIIRKQGTDNYYKITWSNYHRQVSANPGCFKLSFYKMKLPVKYLNDELARRRDNPSLEVTQVWISEWERVDPFFQALHKRFGSKLTNKIIDQIFNHPIFSKHYAT